MNYAYVYFQLVCHRLENPLPKLDKNDPNYVYTEDHHIIPRAEGGPDSRDNLVAFTAREHYVAHLLLGYIYNDSKMWRAVYCMRMGHGTQRNFRYNSHLFAHAREHHSRCFSGENNPQYGTKWSDERREYMSKKMSGQKRPNISTACRGKPKPWSRKTEVWERKDEILEWFDKGVAAASIRQLLGLDCARAVVEKIIRESGRDVRSCLDYQFFTNGRMQIKAKSCPEGFVPGKLSVYKAKANEDRICAMYEEGKSTKEICAEVGSTRSTVQRILGNHGYQLSHGPRKTKQKTLVYRGELLPVMECVQKYGAPGVTYPILWQRLKSGWDVERAVETPAEKMKKTTVRYRGQEMTLDECVKKYAVKGVTKSMVASRLKLGWDIEDALFKPKESKVSPLWEKADEIREKYERGLSMVKLAEWYNCSTATIYKIVTEEAA